MVLFDNTPVLSHGESIPVTGNGCPRKGEVVTIGMSRTTALTKYHQDHRNHSIVLREEVRHVQSLVYSFSHRHRRPKLTPFIIRNFSLPCMYPYHGVLLYLEN